MFKKNKKIKRENDFLEPEEILLNKEINKQGNIQRVEREIDSWGIKLLIWLSFLFLFLSLIDIFNLSIIHKDDFRLASKDNFFKFIPVLSERGLIYDRFDNVLVKNIPVFNLILFPRQLPENIFEREGILEKIGNFLNLSIEELKEKIEEDNEFLFSVVLKKNLTSDEVIFIESHFSEIPYLQISKQNFREYLFNQSFSHIVGYLGSPSKKDLEENPDIVNFDKLGKYGLEYVYDKELRGSLGKIAISRNAKMEVLGQDLISNSVSGNNLRITIDSQLQNFLFERLKEQIKKLGGEKGGLAIVINSQTGEVLSLVNYPSFDVNIFNNDFEEKEFDEIRKDSNNPLFNRAISGLYNPGSTIKPIIASMALEEGIISPDEKIETKGYISIPNPYYPDNPSIFVDWKNHGFVDMFSAIARSSNIYFYILGGGYQNYSGLGIDRIEKYLDKFGFENLTGIDLLGEEYGFIPTPYKKKGIWRIGDTYITSIGQGDLLVSPIRLLLSLNSLINGGRLLKPRLVSDILQNGNSIWKSEVEIENINFVSNKNLEIIKQAMTDTIRKWYGTGNILSNLPFSVGGKSGTAQTNSKTKLNSLFFAFAPVERPQISILVLIEDAREDMLNSIPVVQDTLLWWWQNRGFE
jgi:penicillin-binding protein 2